VFSSHTGFQKKSNGFFKKFSLTPLSFGFLKKRGKEEFCGLNKRGKGDIFETVYW